MDLYNLVVSAKLTKGGGGDEPVLIDKSIDANGTYKASDDSADGYKKVTVSVPSSGITPVGTKNITENGVFDVTDFASASVSVPVGVFPSGTSSITANGIYNIESFQSVDVNVSGGGGGITVDEIATRKMSGVMNGSANAVYSYAFYACQSITAASFPSATSIGSYAFASCTGLTTASFPSATSIGSYAFGSCTGLTTVSFPNATSIGGSAFQYCSSLTTVSFPNVKSMGNYAFASCTGLTTASFPNVTSMGNYAFASCTSLMSLYVLASSVANLGNVNTFSNTPMSNSTYTGSFGSIYVPASLVDTYKSKANWSAYSNRITSYVE